MATRPAYGKRGDPIPGTHLVRDYCGHCGEAIRVVFVEPDRRNYCLDCDGHQRAGRLDYTPEGQRVGFGRTSC